MFPAKIEILLTISPSLVAKNHLLLLNSIWSVLRTGLPDTIMDNENPQKIRWVCLKIVYPYTQWLMIIIPTKWL